MGGNLFKYPRINKIEYQEIIQKISDKFSLLFERFQIPYQIEDKETYGDVDFLVIPAKDINVKQKIEEIFHPTKIFSNGNIYSFDIENFQVDLILTTKENWDCYFNFLSWGDFSMILGRVARLYKLKYGIDGLSLPIRDPIDDHVIEVISISKDLRQILTFFGYDAEIYFKGFKTKGELRNFIFSSKKINQGFLTKDSENCTHRKRDRKREAYKEIYSWFRENREKFPPKPEEEPFIDLLNEIDLFFPESQVKDKYFAALKQIDKIKRAREKFSGEYIGKLLGIEKKELGITIEKWSKKFKNKSEKVDYILNTDTLALDKEIKEAYEQISR